jgi:hypothetical protein
VDDFVDYAFLQPSIRIWSYKYDASLGAELRLVRTNKRKQHQEESSVQRADHRIEMEAENDFALPESQRLARIESASACRPRTCSPKTAARKSEQKSLASGDGLQAILAGSGRRNPPAGSAKQHTR